jgi:hypothetical protein
MFIAISRLKMENQRKFCCFRYYPRVERQLSGEAAVGSNPLARD